MLTLTDDKLLKFVLILGKSCVAFVWGEKLGWPRTLFIILLLCSKCYFVEDEKSGKAKKSSKGVSQKQNELLWRRYERALDGYKDMATNRGFRMKDGTMYTYEQYKLGLSAYYDKRWVLEDGIHMEPIEFHTAN